MNVVDFSGGVLIIAHLEMRVKYRVLDYGTGVINNIITKLV